MLVLLLKHIFIKSLKHIIKAFISTYPTLAVIAKCVLSVPTSSAHAYVNVCSVLLVKILGLIAAK